MFSRKENCSIFRNFIGQCALNLGRKEVGFNLQQRIIYWRQIGSLIVLFCFRLNINLEMWSEAEKAAVKLQDTKNRLTEIFREAERCAVTKT